MRQSSSPAAPTATAAPYAERLGLPWWAWPAGLAAAGLLAVELWMGATGVRAWLPFVLLIPAAVAALWWLGRTYGLPPEGMGAFYVLVRAVPLSSIWLLYGLTLLVGHYRKARASS